MSFFRNYFGSARTLPKPRKPLRVDHPDFSRIYLHNTESIKGFRWVATRLNFLTEMMKFFPTHEQVGYAGEPSDRFVAALHEFGNAEGSPFWEGEEAPPRFWDGEGTPPAGDYYTVDEHGNPIHSRSNTPWDDGDRGYTRDHFGSWHRVSKNSLPWGFFEGNKARNLNFHPEISEYNHFKNPSDEKHSSIDRLAQELARTSENDWNIDSPIPASAYSGLFGFEAESYDDIWDEGKSFSNDRNSVMVLSGGIRDTLNSDAYKGKSYYQIVMSGFKHGADIAYRARTGGGEEIKWAVDDDWDNNDREIHYNGCFDYDGKAGFYGEDAFKLMLGLLESRRRIFYALVNVFGDNEHIGRQVSEHADPNDQAMINTFNAWASRGADPHNVSLFSLFLYAQHSLHSILPAYSFNPAEYSFNPASSNGGLPGWIFSGKDQLAFQRFNLWLYKQVASEDISDGITSYKEYLNSLDSRQYPGLEDYKRKVNNLIREFYGTDGSQPYINTTYDGGYDVSRAGWDRYSIGSNWADGDPARNPLVPGPHPDYVIAQLTGMNLLGNRNGNVYNSSGLVKAGLASENWAVHHVLGLLRYADWDVGRTVAINAQNRRNNLEFKKRNEEYHETKIELQREEARDEAKAKQRAAELRADLNALAAKARKREDELKMAAAASVRAKIQEKIFEKKAKERKAQDRKKK